MTHADSTRLTEAERGRLTQALMAIGGFFRPSSLRPDRLPLPAPASGPQITRWRAASATLPSWSLDFVLVTLEGQRWICTSRLPSPRESGEGDMGPVAARRCPPLDGSWSREDGLEVNRARGVFQLADLRSSLHPWIQRMSAAERWSALPTLDVLVYQTRGGDGLKPLGEPHRSLSTVPEQAQRGLRQPLHLERYDFRQESFPERIPDAEAQARGTGAFLYQRVPHETQSHGQTERLLWVDLEVTETDWNLTRRLLWEASEHGEELS